jgi:hypothetical protein
MELPTIVATKTPQKGGWNGVRVHEEKLIRQCCGREWMEMGPKFYTLSWGLHLQWRSRLVAVGSFVIVALLDRDDHVDY